MSEQLKFMLNIVTQQGPLEQRKKAIEFELIPLRETRDSRQANKERILQLNKEFTQIIKKLALLNKASALATKKSIAEIDGSVYKITLDDVKEVGGTDDELAELEAMLSGLTMTGGRRKKNRTRKYRNRK
jgi:hypothetical protein